MRGSLFDRQIFGMGVAATAELLGAEND